MHIKSSARSGSSSSSIQLSFRQTCRTRDHTSRDLPKMLQPTSRQSTSRSVCFFPFIFFLFYFPEARHTASSCFTPLNLVLLLESQQLRSMMMHVYYYFSLGAFPHTLFTSAYLPGVLSDSIGAKYLTFRVPLERWSLAGWSAQKKG